MRPPDYPACLASGNGQIADWDEEIPDLHADSSESPVHPATLPGFDVALMWFWGGLWVA
jgi:hypothetical protein